MRVFQKYFYLLLSILLSYPGLLAQKDNTIPLYEGEIPGSLPKPANWEEKWVEDGIWRVSKVYEPNLSVYLPDPEKANGAAVIICPGGGYSILAIDHEGFEFAEWFNSFGVAAFVLKYRLPDDQIMEDKKIGPLQDAQQAIRLVRSRAKAFNIDPEKIGIMGFSAGGHLASTALTWFDEPVGDIQDPTSCRPDFGILVYPVISFIDDFGHKGSRVKLIGEKASKKLKRKYSSYLQVNEQTPPTFLLSTTEDTGVPPENSYVFYKALKDHQVPAELHIYGFGPHGFGMGKGKGPVSTWSLRCKEWMQALKVIP